MTFVRDITASLWGAEAIPWDAPISLDAGLRTDVPVDRQAPVLWTVRYLPGAGCIALKTYEPLIPDGWWRTPDQQEALRAAGFFKGTGYVFLSAIRMAEEGVPAVNSVTLHRTPSGTEVAYLGHERGFRWRAAHSPFWCWRPLRWVLCRLLDAVAEGKGRPVACWPAGDGWGPYFSLPGDPHTRHDRRDTIQRLYALYAAGAYH